MATDSKNQNYRTYIFQILKQVHPTLGISSLGMEVMNSFVIDMLERIAKEASNLLNRVDWITLTAREIEAAVRLCLPGEVCDIYHVYPS